MEYMGAVVVSLVALVTLVVAVASIRRVQKERDAVVRFANELDLVGRAASLDESIAELITAMEAHQEDRRVALATLGERSDGIIAESRLNRAYERGKPSPEVVSKRRRKHDYFGGVVPTKFPFESHVLFGARYPVADIHGVAGIVDAQALKEYKVILEGQSHILFKGVAGHSALSIGSNEVKLWARGSGSSDPDAGEEEFADWADDRPVWLEA